MLNEKSRECRNYKRSQPLKPREREKGHKPNTHKNNNNNKKKKTKKKKKKQMHEHYIDQLSLPKSEVIAILSRTEISHVNEEQAKT